MKDCGGTDGRNRILENEKDYDSAFSGSCERQSNSSFCFPEYCFSNPEKREALDSQIPVSVPWANLDNHSINDIKY